MIPLSPALLATDCLTSLACRGLSYAGGRVPATTQNVIAGQWVESAADRWIDVNNPATNKVCIIPMWRMWHRLRLC